MLPTDEFDLSDVVDDIFQDVTLNGETFLLDQASELQKRERGLRIVRDDENPDE